MDRDMVGVSSMFGGRAVAWDGGATCSGGSGWKKYS